MSKMKIDYTDATAVRSTLLDGNAYSPQLLASSIRSIAGAGAKLDARIHATAHALMSRATIDRDCSLVPALIDAMPKSARRKALIAWFAAFSNVVILTDAKGSVSAKMHKPDTKLFKDNALALLDDAWARPFYSVEEKSVDPAAFNDGALAKAVAALIKRATADGVKLGKDAVAAVADLKVLSAKLAPAA